jgi:hypothetical protein
MSPPRLTRFHDDDVFVPPPGSNLRQCEECTILIGEGYQETHPFLAPDGVSIVCSQCYESLLRRARREAPEPELGSHSSTG